MIKIIYETALLCVRRGRRDRIFCLRGVRGDRTFTTQIGSLYNYIDSENEDEDFTMMKVTDNELDILKEKIRKIKSEVEEKYQIEELGLFGSYVRGEQTESSDIDLLVTFKPEARFGLFTYCELQNLLSDKLGKKVDLVMKKGLKPHIGKHILREVIYL